MYVLSGQSLTKADWFRPETMSLNIEERKSTATLTIGPGAPAIGVGAWLLDETEPGAGIVWRVKTVEEQYNTKTRTVQLEHVINTLKDVVMFGEVGPAQIKNNSSATTCTAWEAISYILSNHPLWDVDANTWASDFNGISNPYTFNGDDLLSALEKVLSSLNDAYIDYNLTAIPFKINVRKLSSDVGSEMRMSRNIQTIRRTVDRSRMYTRLYPIGENDLHIDGDYVSRNEGIYGTVCKIETESSKKTKAELLAWADERLSRHCEPSVTVTVGGLELSQDTGEPLDNIKINRKCRVPLPEFNTTIVEKVTKLSWSDKIREPKKVTVTLANQREDIASIVNKINKSAKSASRTKAKKDKDDHAWIVDDKNHIALVAEKVFGEGTNWSQVATLTVSGDGIYGDVTRAKGDIVVAQGKLIVEADKAGLVVKALDQRPILCYANRAAFPATGSSGNLYLAVDTGKYYQWNGSTYTEVAKSAIHAIHSGEIVTAINNNNESVARIRADHVTIGGTNSVHTLAGAFDYTDDGKLYIKDAGGMYVKRTDQGVDAFFGVWDEGNLTGGIIVGKVNGQTATRIKGTKINIGDSDTTGGVTIADAFEISGSYTKAKRPFQVGSGTDQTTINGGAVTAMHFDTRDGGDIRIYKSDGSGPFTINYASWGALLTGVQVNGGNVNQFRITDNSGNTYDIYKSGNDLVFKDNTNNVSWTFSKATTLSPTWSSGSFPLTISASPQNVSKTVGFTNASDIYLEIDKNGTPAQFGNSKKLINVPYKVTHHAGEPVGDQVRYTGSIAAVDATSVYNFGFDDVVLSDPDWQYPAANHNSDNTTASNSVIVAASNKTDGTTRAKTIPIGLYVDVANKQAYVAAGGYKRAVASLQGVYDSGRAHVTLEEPTWNENTVPYGWPENRTITVKTSGRTDASGTTENLEKQIPLYLVASNLIVYLRTNSVNGTTYARKILSDVNLVSSNIKKDVTIFGVTGTMISGTHQVVGVEQTDSSIATFTCGDSELKVQMGETDWDFSRNPPRKYVTLHKYNGSGDYAKLEVLMNNSGGQASGNHEIFWDNNNYTYNYNGSWKPSSRIVYCGDASEKLYLVQSSWSGNTKNVYLRKGSESGYSMAGIEVVANDSNLVAGNIKSGVTIFGVTGTYNPTQSHNITWDNGGNAYGQYIGGQIWKPTMRTISCGNASVWIGLKESAWGGNKKQIRIVKDSWNGTEMAGIEVVANDSNLVAGNIKSGVTIFGVTGTYNPTQSHNITWDNGGNAYGQYIGGQIWKPTMRTISCGNASVWIGLKESAWGGNKKQIRIVKDSWNGTEMAGIEVVADDSNLVAGNIKSGVTIFGVTGSYSGSHDITWDNGGNAYGQYIGGQIWKPTSRLLYCGNTSEWIGIEQYDWSNGSKQVKVLKDTWSGTAMMGVTVDAPYPELSTPAGYSSEPSGSHYASYSLSAGYDWFRMKIVVGGKTYWVKIHVLRS